MDVGIGSVPWTADGPAGRSVARYDVVLLADGTRLLPTAVTLVFVVKASAGETTATTRIEFDRVGVPRSGVLSATTSPAR
jgi:hypothetical protein